MENTEFLGLNQPQYVDPADILRINESMDIIDKWAELTDGRIASSGANLIDHNISESSHPYILEELASKANKSLPEEIALPLGESMAAMAGTNSIYCKDDMSTVFVRMAVYNQGNVAVPSGATIAYLPEGYRPSTLMIWGSTVRKNGSYSAANYDITTAGEIKVFGIGAVAGDSLYYYLCMSFKTYQ